MPVGPQNAPRPKDFKKKPRAKTSDRGYGHAHQKLREALLAAFPLCQVCEATWATDLHHINGDPFDRRPDNCLMCCEACHHGKIHSANAN